jgi:hypothetical protein
VCNHCELLNVTSAPLTGKLNGNDDVVELQR